MADLYCSLTTQNHLFILTTLMIPGFPKGKNSHSFSPLLTMQEIKVNTGKEVLNFCANNYLGLANNPQLVDAAIQALKERAYGMASVRFICGTSDLHKLLEAKIAKFFGTEDTILYAACFDANGGVFEPLLTEEDKKLLVHVNDFLLEMGIDY